MFLFPLRLKDSLLTKSLRCWIAGFLHQGIYTLQHIREDDSFYLACTLYTSNFNITVALQYVSKINNETWISVLMFSFHVFS